MPANSVGDSNTIDKRLFLTALTCPTQGWYQFRAPVPPLDAPLEWLFYGGNQYGDIGRRQLGAGRMLPRSPESLAVDTTRQACNDPAQSLPFEASFEWQRCVARADALRRNGDGWDLIEIKASKPKDNGKPKPEYLDDLGYTTMVARGAGLAVSRCILLLINRDYRLGADSPVMIEIDVTSDALERAELFANAAPEVVDLVLADARPSPEPKIACRNCNFFTTTCLGVGIAHSVFTLPRLTEKRLDLVKPELDLLRIPADFPLSPSQQPVFEAIRSGVPVINAAGLAALDQVVWPAYYLDFETVAPAVPWFTGDAAYETIPFQYSLHICDGPGHVVAHHEYLAPLDSDWRVELLEGMLAALGTRGSILVYTDFEERRLRELALRHPGYAGDINAVIARLFDLERVVREGYTHPGFGGRTSIKKVSPVMAPELSYKELAIGEGSAASAIFGMTRVGKYATGDWQRQRNHLLTYCKLDTLAMVRVHEELGKIRR